MDAIHRSTPLSELSPDPTTAAAPPTSSRWGFWGTCAWGVGAFAAFYLTQFVVLVGIAIWWGFDPANPTATDNGCDETVVLGNDVSQGITNGSGVAKAAGFIQIDGTNQDVIRAVIAAFPGGTNVCAALAQSWIDQASAPGFTWDVPPDGFNPQDGHCFMLSDFDPQSALIWTWGMPARITWAALAACTSTANGGALYLVCDQEVLNAASQRAPDGLDWATLISDFNSLGGTVPAPAPAPPDPPIVTTLSKDDVKALLDRSWPA